MYFTDHEYSHNITMYYILGLSSTHSRVSEGRHFLNQTRHKILQNTPTGVGANFQMTADHQAAGDMLTTLNICSLIFCIGNYGLIHNGLE